MAIYNRRSFLKRYGALAVGIGLGGCATNTAATASHRVVRVKLDAEGELINRTFAILKDRIEQRCPLEVVEVRSRPDIVLTVDEILSPEAFRVDQHGKAVRVSGGSPRGLLYGAGKFLRTSRYADGFEPSEWRGTSEPNGTMRGMYFASHFHNWYHQASEAEIARYMEDLALWGVNAVMVIFPMINLEGWDDPQAETALAMLRQAARSANGLGLQFVTSVNNTMFKGAPQDIRAGRLPDPLGRRGNSGHPVCPSNPSGHKYLMDNAQMLFERLSDVQVDALVYWPYDEGGCSCQDCAPWGSNGYLRISRDFTMLARRYFPNVKTILSTWMFDTPPEGEWQGLTDALAKDPGWVDYILADSHEDFPRYPLDVAVPGNLPLLNFPEISMWGNWPWGGVGAHPLPGRFQRLWDQVKHKVTGGFPYSEGIYEDMNKAAVVQFYWDPGQPARATLEEYIAYEFGAGVIEDVMSIVDSLEAAASAAAVKQPVDVERVKRANQLAEAVNQRLADWARNNWRWEILYLRTILDRERFAGGGLESDAAQNAMLRLVQIYHCQIETDDPYHHRVRPRVRGAVDRAGRA